MGPAGVGCFAEQLRAMLGEDSDLEWRLFEDRWKPERPFAVVERRSGRTEPAKAQDFTFAELSGVGSFSYLQASAAEVDSVRWVSTNFQKMYGAPWLQGTHSEVSPRAEDVVSETSGEFVGAQARGVLVQGSMTYLRACELLGIDEGASMAQIKAAYRRMVCEWHPDRLEQSAEGVRLLATKKMTAINEAYRLLRETAAVAIC